MKGDLVESDPEQSELISEFSNSSRTSSPPTCSSSLTNCHKKQIKYSHINSINIHKGQSIRVCVKVLVPVEDHPNFNFVGKLLGPKGNSLKWLQEVTQTKMAILGRGSMRDSRKEEELRLSGDSRYHHLNDNLHVEIIAYALPSEAYTRIGHALNEVKRFLIPDYYDDIRRQQLSELGVLNKINHKCKSKNGSNQGNISAGGDDDDDDGNNDQEEATDYHFSSGNISSISGCKMDQIRCNNRNHIHRCYMNNASQSSGHHHISIDCSESESYCSHATEEDKDWNPIKSGKTLLKMRNRPFLPYSLHRDCCH